jgi:hypothetical protein
MLFAMVVKEGQSSQLSVCELLDLNDVVSWEP